HVIEEIARPLKALIPFKLTIPGLLFIDTPGHELFASLRRRGGSVADFAVLVIDVNEGVKEQTDESIELLRQRKVPFLVAANKIDRVPGWRPQPNEPFILSAKKQSKEALRALDDRIYRLIGQLAERGFLSDRFDRIRDFTKTVAIVPVSAKTGEGVAELLAVLAGLTQQYLKDKLVYAEGLGRGVLLELKEEPGLGLTADAILYDGALRRGDTIVFGSSTGAVVTRVRALLMPKPLQEIRSPEDRFVSVEEVHAACGVKIVAPRLEEAVPGGTFYSVANEAEIEEYKRRVIEEIESVRIKTDKSGLVVKADTLGTLEALVEALRKRDIPVRLADVGHIVRRDVIEAAVSLRESRSLGVILGFNVKLTKEAELEAAREGVKVILGNITYRIIEEYEEWKRRLELEEVMRELETIVRPAKIRIIPGCVFRRSEPAIVGVEVLGGVLRPGAPLMRSDGRRLGVVMQLQDKGRAVEQARAGAQIAISIRGNVMVGRHVEEGDVLYTDVPDAHARALLTKFRQMISDDEVYVLKEIAEIKRRTDPLYALV
ncbi:MAG: translation initiation factor IF-2, partial [Fervidicoccaceae archaeon]